MVIDSSALTAILLNEPERPRFNAAIFQANVCLVSLVSVVETSIVLESRKGPVAVSELDLFLAACSAELRPVLIDQMQAARLAYRLFGKGRHRAQLNLGDCFTYALAKTTGEPILCKGSDLGLTDVSVVSV